MVATHYLSKAVNKYNAKLDVKYLPATITQIVFSNAVKVKLPNGHEAVYDVQEVKEISESLQDILCEIFRDCDI